MATIPYQPFFFEWALAYAQAGYKILPLEPDHPHECNGSCNVGKLPLRLNSAVKRLSYTDATTNASTIMQWWQQCPYANIGLACSLNNLIAIDLDKFHKPGVDGVETFLEWWANKGEKGLPQTPIQITATAGLHLVFTHPQVKAKRDLMPGVEVKSLGYIVVQPSLRRFCKNSVDGGRYRWLRLADADYSLPGLEGLK